MSNTTAPIQSDRLDLVLMSDAFLEASLGADSSTAGHVLGAQVPAEWLEERGLIALRLRDIRVDPGYAPWTLRAIVARASNAMIGHIGFHTRPGPDYLAELVPGGIELGYTIFPTYRRQGFAREAVAAMIAWAAEQGVPRFVLSISPDNQPSLRIAAALGFTQIGSHEDPEDGLELVFARER